MTQLEKCKYNEFLNNFIKISDSIVSGGYNFHDGYFCLPQHNHTILTRIPFQVFYHCWRCDKSVFVWYTGTSQHSVLVRAVQFPQSRPPRAFINVFGAKCSSIGPFLTCSWSVSVVAFIKLGGQTVNKKFLSQNFSVHLCLQKNLNYSNVQDCPMFN